MSTDYYHHFPRFHVRFVNSEINRPHMILIWWLSCRRFLPKTLPSNFIKLPNGRWLHDQDYKSLQIISLRCDCSVYIPKTLFSYFTKSLTIHPSNTIPANISLSRKLKGFLHRFSVPAANLSFERVTNRLVKLPSLSARTFKKNPECLAVSSLQSPKNWKLDSFYVRDRLRVVYYVSFPCHVGCWVHIREFYLNFFRTFCIKYAVDSRTIRIRWERCYTSLVSLLCRCCVHIRKFYLNFVRTFCIKYAVDRRNLMRFRFFRFFSFVALFEKLARWIDHCLLSRK